MHADRRSIGSLAPSIARSAARAPTSTEARLDARAGSLAEPLARDWPRRPAVASTDAGASDIAFWCRAVVDAVRATGAGGTDAGDRPRAAARSRAARRRSPTRCASTSCTTAAAASSRSAIASRTPTGPGRLDGVVLRPAGVGGAARELRRDRQGRRAAASLVPPRAAGDQRRRPRDADVVGRHDVRVPDAAAADAQLPGHAARSELPRQRAAPDRVRPPARRAVGHLGVGVCVHRSRGQLSVPGVRRARPRPEARALGRPRHRAVRDGAGQPRRSRRPRRRTSSGSPAPGSTAASASTRRSTTARASRPTRDATSPANRGR